MARDIITTGKIVINGRTYKATLRCAAGEVSIRDDRDGNLVDYAEGTWGADGFEIDPESHDYPADVLATLAAALRAQGA